MAFRIHRGIWQFQKPDGAYESKYKLNDSGQLVETDTEGNEVGGMTASVSWTSVSGRPTALSGFTNDLGNYGGWLTTSGKAADSNLLDGINSTGFVRYDGRLSANADTVTYTSVKVWDVSTATDAPSGAADGLLTTKYWDSSSWAVQSYHDFHTNRLYLRSKQSGTWQTSWSEVWTTDNFNPSSYLTTSGKAADSEAVDGIDSSRIVYGEGSRKSTSLSTMNSSTDNVSGFFFYNNPTGSPFSDWTHWINVIGNSWSNNYGFQLAHAFHSDRFAVRVIANGGWGSWRTVIDSGNIGSQSVNYATSAGNSSTTSQTSFGSLSTSGGLRDSLNRRFVIPDGGSYVTSTSVITGAIRIKLPTQGSGMMMTCTAKVYEYSLSKSFTITFGGHRDGNNWYNQFCYIDGDTNRGNLTVRFGVSGGKDCVWIGETNSSWSYPQVFITDMQVGYTAIDSRWASGWSIDFVTSFDTINRTSTAYAKITNANIGDQSVNYATSAGNADTVDGWHRDDLRAWGNLTGVPSTFSPSAHTHDDRYYTESESDTRFATAAQGAKADSALQSLPAHTHDDRYYTESESLSLFARKDTNSAIGGNLVIGNGTYGNATAYGNSGARLMFSGSDSDAQGNYYIGTNHENYGGNYSKLDLRWHTGIRMGAQPGYGGIRFYNNEDLGSRIMSIGESDGNVRIDNNLWIGGAGGWITDLLAGKQAAGSYAAASHTHDDRYYTESEVDSLLAGKQAAGSYAAASHTHDYVPLAGGTMSGTLTLKDISGVSQTVPNSYGAYLHLGNWGVGRTASDAVLVNTAYRADYATDLFDMNISRFTNNSGYITAYGAQGANGNFYIDDNYGNSVVGVYSSTRYQGVYAMGDSYKLAANGTSPGSLYGIAWTHTNVGGESKSGLGHQALFMMNGRTYTAIGSGIWTDGTITTTSHGTSANWKTAYDWGNHASAGYLTSLPSHNHDGSYLPIGGKAADSNLLDGLDLHTGRNNEANKVVRTDGNGYIQAGWINTTSGDNGTTAIARIYASQDGYIRYYTPANFRALVTDGVYQRAGDYAETVHTHTPSQVGLGNVSNAAQVTTSYNSSLNSDSRNSRGVTRLYRRDSDSDYSVQTYWTGARWRLYGYNGDSNHADTHVGYADSAGSASSASSASSATTAVNLSGSNVYTSGNNLYIQNGGVNNYRVHHTGDIGVFDVTSRFSIREMSSIWSATRYQWGDYMSYAWFDVDPWGDNWGIGGNPTSWKTVNRGSLLTFGFEDWSDRRHKSAIVEIDNAVDKVKAISGYTYWKRGSEVREAGVIAQDVLAVLPEAVGGTEEGYSVKPAALIGLLMKAVKEQQETIDALTARIEALENK